MTDSSVEAVARAELLEWASQHSNVTPLDGTDRDSPTFGDLRAALAALPSPEREPMREALNDVHAILVHGAARRTDVERQVVFSQALNRIEQALANPAAIRDTDEDAELVDALIRAARDVEWEAHFGAKWDARRATMLRARERVLSRLASSTPAEPREASGYCPFCITYLYIANTVIDGSPLCA